ncbi:tetratricopeptide repeat protein [Tenacibaculum sp. 1B UA]|uniref:tetratricopeptide repeat-containing sensor histidine kinase n=1 Tax=unclassified Tenacibaculum TaxID=2635139 RepID=UPI0026E26E05|nr:MULTISPECIES: tetratricopeptide repeat-containing sensor histidine kinase [unclassified Tenacibaculum]MDO6676030.1 tetratricopeptide repeat protein [Tenacibaculum sp. 1_MG-2023]MDX8553594.1 tetratricopeptide repeat protein [Tenacibaculum sp. 1B UA]
MHKRSLLFFIIITIAFTSFSYSQEKEEHLYDEYKKAKELFKNEKYSISLEKSLKILSETDSLGHFELKYKTSFLIGNIFRQINDHKKAIIYYKKALTNFKSDSSFKSEHLSTAENSFNINKILLRIGGQFHISKEKDSAIKYYKEILASNSFNQQNLTTKASSYTNLSNIYREDSIYDLAREYSLEAIKIYKKANKKVLESAALGNLASIYLEQKNYEKAKKIYLDGLDLIKLDSSDRATKYKEFLYFNLAYTLYLQKDYRAYDYQEKSYNIKDDLRDIEIRRIVDEIYTKHELNLEKEKTALVEEQRKLEEAQEAKTSMLFGALSFLVLIVSGVIIYNYKLRQKNLRLKLSESKLIQQQNLEKVRSEAQVKILNATIDGKETERKLIAEILHDNVSALLSSANMHLTATKKQFNGDTPQEIEKTQAIISEASQKVRDLSHNLVSSILLKFGLEYAIKDVVKKYSNSQLKLEVSAKNINRYNQEFEIKIFNVIQELINNILKHSKAKHAQIDLKEEKNQLTVLVKDDGVGFSTSSSSFSDGIGLNQVEARIHMMDGKLTIKSEINVGTSIHIAVPILSKEKKLNKLTSVS